MSAIENLGDSEDLVIDQKDLDNLQEGFKESASKRPPTWIRFPGVLKQLVDPTEFEVKKSPTKEGVDQPPKS